MKPPRYFDNGDGRAYIYHRSIPLPHHRLYVGKFGSPESLAEYERFLKRLRENAQDQEIPTHRYMTVIEVSCKYLEHAEVYYRSNPNEFRSVRDAVAGFIKQFAEINADEVGPRAILEYQDSLVKRGLARTTINQMVGRIKRMFKWASSREFVPPETHHKLACIEGLRKGRSKAKEPQKVTPVPLGDFVAMLSFMPPPIRAMTQIQFLCGMRPGEVCLMRGTDINTIGPIWLYRPRSHKGVWRDHELAKAIPRTAQEILRPFLRENPEEYLFRPEDGRKWYENGTDIHPKPERKTRLYPSEARRVQNRKEQRARNPARRLRDHYSTGSYSQAVSRAFDIAEKNGVKINKWSPNQLRHSIATEIRQSLGQQKAQLWLGHLHLSTTDIYAEKQLSELVDVAEKLDLMWGDSGPFAASDDQPCEPTDYKPTET